MGLAPPVPVVFTSFWPVADCPALPAPALACEDPEPDVVGDFPALLLPEPVFAAPAAGAAVDLALLPPGVTGVDAAVDDAEDLPALPAFVFFNPSCAAFAALPPVLTLGDTDPVLTPALLAFPGIEAVPAVDPPEALVDGVVPLCPVPLKGDPVGAPFAGAADVLPGLVEGDLALGLCVPSVVVLAEVRLVFPLLSVVAPCFGLVELVVL